MLTEKLQRVLNTAARVLTEANKYDPGLTPILRSDLHWLHVPERIKCNLCVTVFKCIHGMAPAYLSELCIRVAQIAGRRQLRSAARGQLVVPRTKIMTYGKRAFECAGQSAWNSFPDCPKETCVSYGTCLSSLETFLFSEYGTSKHNRDNLWSRAIANLHLHLHYITFIMGH